MKVYLNYSTAYSDRSHILAVASMKIIVFSNNVKNTDKCKRLVSLYAKLYIFGSRRILVNPVTFNIRSASKIFCILIYFPFFDFLLVFPV